jgi:hypothetical protein
MAKHQNLAEWHGKDLVDQDGHKIGKLEGVYVESRPTSRCSAPSRKACSPAT